MKSPIISVIVPVYNAQQTLRRCIDSILMQSFGDFELIMVNDGSQDKSLEICKWYQDRDGRVKFIHKPNGGVSSARNVGLQLAQGEYITFVDSDDALANCFLENLLVSSEYDLVLSSFITSPHLETIIFDEEVFLTEIEIGRCIMKYATKGFSYPWGKLFKGSIIKKYNLRFDTSLSLGEDTKFVNEYLLHVKLIKLTSYPGYIYTKGIVGSLSRKAVSINYLDSSLRNIITSYLNLENKYAVDLKPHRYDLAQFFLHRFIAPYSVEPFRNVLKALKIVCSHPLINETFYHKSGTHKGVVQIIFDFLARGKHYRTLTLYYKILAYRFF